MVSRNHALAQMMCFFAGKTIPTGDREIKLAIYTTLLTPYHASYHTEGLLTNTSLPNEQCNVQEI